MQIRKHKQKITGGFLAIIGFILSPLSWWNDAFVNIPIAYLCAWVISLFYKSAFVPAIVLFYWVTNIAGFILMHKGTEQVIRKNGERNKYSKKDLLKDLFSSLAYTALILILIKYDVIRPLDEYFMK